MYRLIAQPGPIKKEERGRRSGDISDRDCRLEGDDGVGDGGEGNGRGGGN